MQTMLGAWDKNSGAGSDMGSKLAQRVAINGLAHSYMAFNTNYHDTGGYSARVVQWARKHGYMCADGSLNGLAHSSTGLQHQLPRHRWVCKVSCT